jgi:hypothetical protein
LPVVSSQTDRLVTGHVRAETLVFQVFGRDEPVSLGETAF